MTDNHLVSLLSDPAFLKQHWARKEAILRNAVSPDDFISSDYIDKQLDATLLRWPYLTLVQQGRQPPVSSFTLARDVIGQQRDGFPDGPRVRAAFAAGATLKLNRLADWHRPSRDVLRGLTDQLPGAVASYVFWTPAEAEGMAPHRDASHVVVVQLEGRKEWRLFADSGQVASGAGLDVDAGSPSHTFTLEPGDVLYLPHGWPHVARAVNGPSLHLTFTVTDPTPTQLVEAVLSTMQEDRQDLFLHHHEFTLAEKAQVVRKALIRHLDETPADRLVATANTLLQKESA